MTPVRRALVVSAIFGVLIYLGAQPGRDLFFRSTGVLQLPGSGPPLPHPAEKVRVFDPVERFTQTQVGHLLFSLNNSDMCRRVLFDNRTGAMQEAGQILCGQPPEAVEQPGQERGNAMMRAFRR
jgi:hypothetical protein